MVDNKKTLYLIDGTALIYRAFFAFIKNPLTNSKGENISAAFGFTNTVMNLIRTYNPDYISIAFDTGKPTFRHEMYDEYKATRQKMPSDLIDQIPRVKEAVDALGINQIEMDGYEADDIIGTLAVNAAAKGFEVVMVTGDKDFMQLISPEISMYVPMKNEVLKVKDVVEKYGVPPEKVIDLMGLMGDSSDNVPGIPKVGEKTAVELLKQFGSLDNVIEHSGEISKPSIRKSVEENNESAILSRKLVTIKTDVPVETDIDDLAFHGINTETAREFFREMEFSRLLESLKEPQEIQPKKVTIVTSDNVDAFFEELTKYKEIAVDLETTSLDVMSARIAGISMAAGEKAWYLPIAHSKGENLVAEKVIPRLKAMLNDTGLHKIGHNAKFDAIILKRNGFEVAPFTFDTMIAAYVLDPGSRVYSLAKLADELLNRQMQSITELIGKGKDQKSFAEVDIESAANYSGDDSDVTLKLKSIFAERLDRENLSELFETVEMPLLEVLMDMEMHGVTIDIPFLEEMSVDFAKKMDVLVEQIYESAGEEFNVNSTKQLGEILFEKIGLKSVRKTKTGYSTDIDVLQKLENVHELPRLMLEYRQFKKLKSTYIDALPAIVNPETGRIHTSFNQTITSTGRLSSSNPNLQNIPIRTDLGRNIRKAFIAPPGHILLSADYSQIELRIMAHMSGDVVLTEAFIEGVDVHSKTASILFNVIPGFVNDEQRRQAKTINFGVMYGMGAFSLSEQLGISRKQAKEFIDNYFNTHSGVRSFIEKTVSDTEQNGFVKTLLGRVRYVPDINSTNRNIAEFAKRTAINTPIQGSAADLIKVSMIALWKRLKEAGLKSSMILQVHDELLLEVPEDEIDTVIEIVRETMESAIKLNVPLVVDIGQGKNWLEAH
ncbi:DNA polymerase I [Candidatus Latescibacterota bacterium]